MIHADNDLMFVREKTARGHTYLYLVESLREGGRVTWPITGSTAARRFISRRMVLVKRITTRTAIAGQVGRVFQAAGVALTPNMREHAA